MLWTALSLSLVATGCRTRQEAAGDKFRKAGDPINAIHFYEQALAAGKVSKEFHKNYVDVNVMLLDRRAKGDPSNPVLDELKDSIVSLLRNHPNPETEAKFGEVLLEVGGARINSGDGEGGLRFLMAAEGLKNKPSNHAAQVSALKTKYMQAALKDIEDDYQAASQDPPQGILADYKMNKLSLAFGGKELPEMLPLWSKIRQANLSTYLMYDYEGLITEGLDARINKYGVLLAIVKYDKSGKSVKVQAKAYNGTGQLVEFDGNSFILYDRQGNAYKAKDKIGAFGNQVSIPKGEESKTGGLTFNLDDGAEPHYLELKGNFGVSRKYLP
ncbi:MAG TPA: hypothetical protein VK465_16070 [Fibrobacteria bacterium]|nr:hypothetical protein [Fibrobacteria bacterium]